jgi:hypothetical protein
MRFTLHGNEFGKEKEGETMLTQENFSSVIDEVMHGAIDMHVHFGPDMPPAADLGVARRLDGLGTARQARDAGMRAIVIKSHHWPTGALARTIQPLVPEVALFGTVVLNYSIGGLNPFAVEVGAKIGCKVLLLPPGSTASRFDVAAALWPYSGQVFEAVRGLP